MRTAMDVLLIENFLLLKYEQPSMSDNLEWKKEYALD
jgi:hypothetical protein